MAAHEEQGQRVVLVDGDWRRRFEQGRLELPARSGMLAAPLVDQLATGSANQPRARVRWDAVAGPMVGGGDQRLLDGILRSVEVARAAGERAEDLRRQLAQQVLDAGRDVQRESPRAVWRKASISEALVGDASMTCRMMIGCSVDLPPGPGTAEILAAISIARASESTSTIW